MVKSRLGHVVLVAAALMVAPESSPAHPGKRDDAGGHTCRTSCGKWDLETGQYHLHDAQASVRQREPVAAYVEKVVDGDTLEVRLIGEKGAPRKRVRLLGLDCPESHDNRKCASEGRRGLMSCDEQVPLGVAAGKAAAAIVKQQKVSLRADGPDREDRYGRLLAYVETDAGVDLGLALIRGGHCQDYGWRFPHPRQKAYVAAERTGGSTFARSKPAKLSERELLAPLASADASFKACRPKAEAAIEKLPLTLEVRPNGSVSLVRVPPKLAKTATAKCVSAIATKIRYRPTRRDDNVSVSFSVRWK